MKPIRVDAFDIPSAWFQTVEACMKHGYKRPVFRGARKEQMRKELDWLILNISNPSNRPLVPDVPTGVPPPSSMKAINEYLQYIAIPDKTPEQDYTYGERTFKKVSDLHSEIATFMRPHDIQEGNNIHKDMNQFEMITQFLKETPETNRGIVEVGMATDLLLDHPPCLRLMHFKIRYDKLHLFLVFRSWDAWGGLPMNLGGYQLLKESMVKDLADSYFEYTKKEKGEGKILEDGVIFAASLGTHVYSGEWEYAKQVIYRSAGRKK